MCTAATYLTKDFYMGRNLDFDFSFGEEVAIVPRRFPFNFRHDSVPDNHYAMIGMAHIAGGYPLYYDAVNEKGLGITGLNFVGNAKYFKPEDGKRNVAQFEFIPWLLSLCSNLDEAKALIKNTNLTDTPFNESFAPAELHWLIADKSGAIVVESCASGLNMYEDPVGVLTNNPPFDKQLFNLNNYMKLSPKQPENMFSDKIDLAPYSRGMGALGLPGDLSSSSRFVRAAFTRMNSVSGDSEKESVGQFFNILGSVWQQKGCCEVSEGKYEYTIYSSCWNAQKGIYYYKTYNNSRITAVDMHKEDLDGETPVTFALSDSEDILFRN